MLQTMLETCHVDMLLTCQIHADDGCLKGNQWHAATTVTTSGLMTIAWQITASGDKTLDEAQFSMASAGYDANSRHSPSNSESP